jgi:ankyrin repeat protein
MTTVMSAAFSGNAEIVEYLMQQGASVNAVNHFNGTAYTIAKIKKHKEVLALLAPHYSPKQDLSPYRIAADLLYMAIVRRIRYYHYKIRYYTGLTPFELNEEL